MDIKKVNAKPEKDDKKSKKSKGDAKKNFSPNAVNDRLGQMHSTIEGIGYGLGN